MPAITSLGVGSGIDVRGLVEKLVSAEGEPVQKRLDRKEAKLQSSLTSFAVFEGALTEFQTSLDKLKSPEAFTRLSLEVKNEDVLSGVISGDADPGVYDIEVIQLAQPHRLVSGTFNSDLAAIGSGAISIQFGEYDAANGEFNINPDRPIKNIIVNDKNNSLRGIQRAINDAEIGLKASVINDGKGFRLIISSEIPGTHNSIRMRVNDDDGTQTDLHGLSTFSFEPGLNPDQGQNLRTTAAATDARIRIDGVSIDYPDNTIENVISGVTLQLTPDSPGKLTTLKVFQDKQTIASMIREFITAYNAFYDQASELTSYDVENHEAGPLAGDSAVQGIMARIRRDLGTNFSSVNASLSSLSALGIDTERSGRTVINGNKIETAISNNINELAQLFTETGSADDIFINFKDATPQSKPGSYDIFIEALATQGNYRGERVVFDGPKQVVNNENTFKIRVGNTLSDTISIEPRQYRSLTQLGNELQTRINSDRNLRDNDESVSVSVENNQLAIVSNRYGALSKVAITEIHSALEDITGLEVGTGIAGTDVKGIINSRSALGKGRNLTGQGDAHGIQIEVLDGALGRRGQVAYSRGIATRLEKTIGNFLGENGVLENRLDGLNVRVKDIGQQREKLVEKLEKSEKRHLKTFSDLDAMVGKMRATSSYLSGQLANLPGARRANNSRPK